MSNSLNKISKSRDGQSTGRGPLGIKGQAMFEREVLEADTPVIVDFWAPWCQPCKMMGPIFAAAAEELAGKVKLVKVDTQANPSIAQAFHIASIPSLLVFDRGEVIDARIGLTPKAHLMTLAHRALDKHDGVGLFDRMKRIFGTGRVADTETKPAADGEAVA